MLLVAMPKLTLPASAKLMFSMPVMRASGLKLIELRNQVITGNNCYSECPTKPKLIEYDLDLLRAGFRINTPGVSDHSNPLLDEVRSDRSDEGHEISRIARIGIGIDFANVVGGEGALVVDVGFSVGHGIDLEYLIEAERTAGIGAHGEVAAE